MDKILQVEALLDLINILFAKAIAFTDDAATENLSALRKKIYYDKKFNYSAIMKELTKLSGHLSQYD